MKLICQNNEDYERARRNWDPWTSLYPKCVAYAQNNDDIIKAIKYCKEHHIPIRIRSGGHGLGKDTSSVNGGLVVDISALTDIKYRKDYVSVGAGIRIGPLIKALAEKGFTFPNGDATTVGAGGIIQGGGIGLTNKKLGLCCDNILGFQMITADCRVIESDEDLLWGAKGGGGGNFGVITKFRVKYNKVPEQITRFDLVWTKIDVETMKNVIWLWLNDIQGKSLDICTSISVTKNGEFNFDVVIEGLNYGNKPFVIPKRSPDHPILTSVTSTYKDMVDRLNTPYENNDNYKFASFWSDKPLPTNAVDIIVEYVSKNNSDFYILDLGGEFNKNKHGSFPWRNAILYFELSAIWGIQQPDSSAPLEVARKKLDHYSLGAYVNVPNNNIKDYEKQYYGENRYRLRAIKRKIDPTNFFNFSQSIKIQHKTNNNKDHIRSHI